MSSVAGAAGTPEPPEPVFLERLSDEELVLLDAEHPLVELPHHGRLTEFQQQAALTGALRALRVRGHEIDTGARTVTLPRHVCDLLDLRAAAHCVLLVQVITLAPRDGSESASHHYVFVEGDLALVEDVSAEGVHDFWAVDLADLADAIQERVAVPDGARDGTGSSIRVDLMAVAAGDSQLTVDCLGAPLVRLDATVWRAPASPDAPLRAIVLGERGTYVSTARFGAEGPITLNPIPVSSVGQEVVRMIGPDTMSR